MTDSIPVRPDVPIAYEPPPGHPERAARGWAFLILLEISNYPMLRRHLGLAGCDQAIGVVAARVAELVPDCRLSTAARHQLEIAFDGVARISLEAALAAIEATFEQPIDFDGEPLAVEIALGAGAMRTVDHDEIRLLEEAERALRDARVERASIARDVAPTGSSVDRFTLARDLAAAIGTEQLFIQYQPKIHIRRQEVCGVEALIRWSHPTRGMVLPSDFIPIAEENRMIVDLTLWTIGQVIVDQKAMIARGHDLPVFINISGVLLGDARFVRRACSLVQAGGTKIGFEITETAVIRDPESAIAHLKVFADIGITIAIDDYGAGLSSLAYLKKLPARELKIDKLFVTQLTSSHRDPLIVRSTIDLAHALEMEVVAEGVETAAAMALLSVMGCDMVQGFFISRPISLEPLLKFLDEDRHLVAAQDVRTPLDQLAARQRA